MKFRYTILYVHDVTRTLDFYQAAFGLSRKFLHESGSYGELDTGTTTLAFSSHDLMRQLGKSPAPADPRNPAFELALETDDVPAGISQAVASGASLVKEATVMPWGQTIGYVSDINGFLIEICTPVGG